MEGLFKFAKMHGAGNDFVVVPDADGRFPRGESDASRLTRALCAPHFGLGSEGLLVLRPGGPDGAAFAMDFRNPDGSVASMCGNGARCAAFFAFRKGWAGRTGVFVSGAGEIGFEVVSADPSGGAARVRVDATEVRGRRGGVRPAALPGRVFDFLDTGVPHAVCFADGSAEDFDRIDVRAEGRAARFAAEFAPDGANADFVRVEGPSAVAVRTYERGVEDETAACGTGAIAAAVAAAERGLVSLPCAVRVRGGDVLVVDARRGGGGLCFAPSLEGPARFVCEGRFDAAWFA